ncbi:uncharacterized protein LOC142987078 [Anticarsia gemmatalis]|uniref:uncharacterized protein LOC142987078 n=1 Tax=Anticarsia gemmatalis TaxID=129554 RepID=UPI003F75E52A
MFGMWVYVGSFTLVTLIISQSSCSKGSKVKDQMLFETILASMKGSESSESSDDSSVSSSHDRSEYDMKDYMKYTAKKERKLAKQQIRDKISEEEEAQLKYFDDLLKKVKALNT